MKPLLPILCAALAAVLFQPAATMQAQSGVLLKTFDLKAGKLLLDPVRPRLYALLPDDNGLAIIDTETDTLLTTIPTGSKPSDLSISPDGRKLFVANSGGPATAGVTVIDLESQTVLTTLSTIFAPTHLAGGLDDRLYFPGTLALYEIDANTGASLGSFNTGALYAPAAAYVQITSDGRTLLYGTSGVSPSKLVAFDVSTATITQKDLNPNAETFPTRLTLSHNGQFCLFTSRSQTAIRLIPTGNLTGSVGTFGPVSGSLAQVFSPDDGLLFNAGNYGQIDVFNTQSATRTNSFTLNYPNNLRYSIEVADLAVTTTKGHLYVSAYNSANVTLRNLSVFSTQDTPFFTGSVPLSNGYYYLKFSDGVPFGYFSFDSAPYLYHSDLGFEYPIDAADGENGIYLYDFTSSTFWYTSSGLFPYLYDFALDTFLYYYPDPTHPDHYNTRGIRYFYNFSTHRIISK